MLITARSMNFPLTGAIRDSAWNGPPDPSALQFSRRCTVEIDEAFGPQAVRLEVRLGDGRRFTREQASMRSLDWPAIVRRFRAAADPVIGASQAAAVVSRVECLESLPSVSVLAQALQPAATA